MSGLCLALLLGCQRSEGDSPTRGRLTVQSAECLAPLARKEVEEFQRLYENTQLTIKIATARETVRDFLRGEVQTIFLDRQFTAAERQIARTYDIRIDSFRIALEGVAVLVHADNPIAALSLEQIGAIYRGETQHWQDLGGREQGILALALSRNTGTAEFMLERVIEDTVFARSVYVCASSPKLLELVAQRENSIGFVSSVWLSDSGIVRGKIADKLKVLKLADDTTERSVALYQASVHRGEYPLRRPLYLFSRDRRLGVAVGLISFTTSAAGQKLILNAGLVPATMPVKLVKLRN